MYEEILGLWLMNSGEMKKLVNHVITALMLVALLIACQKLPENQSPTQNRQSGYSYSNPYHLS